MSINHLGSTFIAKTLTLLVVCLVAGGLSDKRKYAAFFG